MTKAERAKMYADHLTEIGYVPTVYEGEVRFKVEGGTYQILLGDDETFFQLIYPNFWPFKPEKVYLVDAAALKATGAIKVVKVSPTGDHNVSARFENFCEPAAFKAWLPRAFDTLRLAVERFRTEMQ